jgi:uncharacterized protein (DUF1499 family)
MAASPAPEPAAGRLASLWRWIVLTIAVLIAGLFIGAQMGLLAGKRPLRLGVTDGQLQPVRTQLSNAVSSAATTDYHRIAPLSGGTNAKASFERLRTVVAGMPEATIVVDQPEYIYAEFHSRIWHFVDDVEFLLDEPAGVIEVRSASRLGRKDFGVNRARIESIRSTLSR